MTEVSDAVPERRVAFWFLRHGETDWNARGLSQGNVDIPLNGVGVEQAAQAAGMPSVAAGWGYLGEGQDASRWGADALIDLPLDLLPLLEPLPTA